ncbi:hypothetical protein FIBSPDRAFT_769422 [Athelia psychrophila]|uniref:USP domain-containing protein n=1 Tax=Athelia psychrophila TaxID=1759441 RepID=A0A167TNQ4_9AGAM|nr:hypothetical protein FIBSPDRAFT_769422 [Fibularhizoctonia sp. CBS 109695]
MKTNVSDDNTFPTGFKQDNMNFSCAYDVIFTILYGLWKARQPVWVKSFNKLNPLLRKFNGGLHQHKRGEISLNAVRNKVRSLLHSLDAVQFPYGMEGCSINNLVYYLTKSTNSHQTIVTSCNSCGNTTEERADTSYFVDCMSGISQSTSTFVQEHFNSVISGGCTLCQSDVKRELSYENTPNLLVLALSTFGISISPSVSVRHVSRNRVLHLRGVIYFLDYHFTARLIGADGRVFFYDGRQLSRVAPTRSYIQILYGYIYIHQEHSSNRRIRYIVT